MRLAILWMAGALLASASAFSVTDPYGQPKCAPGVTTGCDVVGTTIEFDFKIGNFNFGPTSGSVQLFFDYGAPGQTNLAPFAVTASTTISIADIFFYTTDGQIFAIPLYDRSTASWGNATAGTVYRANSGAAQLTSNVVLNNPTDVYYRPGNVVWVNTLQSTVASVGTLVLAPGTAQGTRWMVTINFNYAAGSQLANALNDPGLTFYTGTATCANDLVSGSASPEPASWMMLSSGLGLAAFAMRRRSRR
jgi:hypothetical protein